MALAVSMPRITRADTPAFISPGAKLTYISGTVGYTFTLAGATKVTQLGFFDIGADGLRAAVPVTIWNNSGAALLTATIPAGTNANEVGQYLYVSLNTPVTLTAGTYTIGW